MLENIHQRDQPAVAPAHDSGALRIEKIVVSQHPLRAFVNVVHFPSPVVDGLPEIAPVSGTAAVVGGYHGVALLDQFTHNMRFAGVEIGVDSPMDQNHQGLLLRLIQIFRDEGVCPDDERVDGPRRLRIGHMDFGQTGVLDLVDVGDIPEFQVPHHIVNRLQNLVEPVVRSRRGRRCRGGRTRGRSRLLGGER